MAKRKRHTPVEIIRMLGTRPAIPIPFVVEAVQFVLGFHWSGRSCSSWLMGCVGRRVSSTRPATSMLT